MSAPEIRATQSVLGYLQYQTWSFQPYATNGPTSWQTSPLPPGMTINPVTGLISGAVTSPGVFVIGLRAGNDDGLSEIVEFAIGIEAASPTIGSDVDVTIDVLTGRVDLGVAIPPLQSSNTSDVPPAFWAKLEDDRIYNVRLVKGGATLDLPVTEMNLALKEFDTDAVLVESSAWKKSGTGDAARYRVYVKFSGAALEGALSNYQSDDGTQFKARMEFEWLATNPDHPDFGPETLRQSSATFPLLFIQDLVPNS